jgi:hypothetical protein
MFCPACWKFLEPSDLDVLGRCAVSLKEPVEVKAATLTWLWCRSHQAWHRRPCHGDTALSVESTALLVPDGSEPMTARAYCPADQMISDFGHAGVPCPVCCKPFVWVETVERRWYWCRTENTWLRKPCQANGSWHCCSPRSGAVLATTWQVPLPRDIGAAPAE